jgi:hypothetical protein
MLHQADPIGLEHLILAGGRIRTSPTLPSPMTIPSFAWKLTDQEVADVSTFIRNSWGNQAAAVSVSDVRAARKKPKLNLDTVHLTANSGDQNKDAILALTGPIPRIGVGNGSRFV